MQIFKKTVASILSVFMFLGMFSFDEQIEVIDEMQATASGQTFTSNSMGKTSNGMDYEFWTDVQPGSGANKASMTLTGDGSFTCEYDTTNYKNTLMRTGMKFGGATAAGQTHQQMGNISLEYNVDYYPGSSGASYMCIYGWTRADNNAPLVEYYIVDSWGAWRPPGNTGSKGNVTIDGIEYEIFETDRINQPSIIGDTTFKQYWSVRTSKLPTGNMNQTIDITKHFEAWEAKGLKLGSLYEVSLCIEGYDSTGSANVKKNEITIGSAPIITSATGQQPVVTTTATPTPPPADGFYFHSDYESKIDSWESRGDATVTLGNTGLNGSKGLTVTNRTSNWHGAARSLSTSAFVPGSSYSFSGWVMQDSIASEDFSLTLQYTDSSGDQAWDTIASGTATSGEWVLLENTNYTIPAGASDLLIYFEAAGDTTSFFVDEAIGAVKGTSNPATNTSTSSAGDVNKDGAVDAKDLNALKDYILGKKVTISGEDSDLDGNGVIDSIDLTLLRRVILALQNTPSLPVTTTPAQPAPVAGEWYNTADISWIDASKPMVALTFDDGPVGTASNSSSIRIQNALTDNGFHATFFYWGNRINSNNEAEILRAHQRGFEVANHTFTHPDLTTLSASQIKSEISQTADILTRITGQTNFLIRPPYLAVNSTLQQNSGAPLINCAIDSQDWNNASAQQMINTITSKMNDGSLRNSIVLMHETYDATADAIEYLLPYLKSNGWQVVTVSEMFKVKGKTMLDGAVYTSAN